MKAFLMSCFLFISVGMDAQSLPYSQFAPKYYVQNNDLKTTGTFTSKKLAKILSKQGYVYVPAMQFKAEEQDGYDTCLNITDTLTTSDFWILTREVTNAQFKEFIQKNRHIKLPDSTAWQKSESLNESYKNYYYQLPSFDEFPVVGVNYEQCVAWCKWQTAEINQLLKKNGLDDWEAIVELPLESEWLAAYEYAVVGALKKYSTTFCFKGIGPSYIAYFTGCGSYKANFGGIGSMRGNNIKNNNLGVTGYLPSKSQSYPAPLKIYNLCGNVAEWTRTSAASSLFNQLQYIYTSSGKLIVNDITHIDSQKLKKLLFKKDDLENHFTVKGGGWTSDLYYLQPRAMEYHHQSYSNAAIGFRPVLYIKNKSRK